MTMASVHQPTAPHFATIEVDRELRLVDGSIVTDGETEMEIVHELARGGMSVVYRAIDHRSEQEIALKVADAGCSGHAAARFREEARLGAKLGCHPHIVRPLRVAQLRGPRGFAGRAYLAMELVHGESLAAVMGEHRIGLQWPQACRIARDVALALEALHGCGIVHRDIKPANVLLTAEKPRAMLIDFGLGFATGDGWAERSPSLTQDGHAPGTLLYMSPEQLGHARPAPSMDIYSFGVMLYEMFTGNPPYHRLSQAEMIAKKCDPTQVPYPLAKVCPELDGKLSALVNQCLLHSPTERPTAAETREILERVLADHVAPRDVRRPSRRLLLAAAIAVCTLTMVGLLAWVLQAEPEASVQAPSQPAASLGEHSAAPGDGSSTIVPPPSKVATPRAVPSKVDAPAPESPREQAPVMAREPRQRPSEDAPDPCAGTVQAARAAKRESKWGAVIRLTSKEQCWRGNLKIERKMLRTQALFETGKFADCVDAGEGLTDPDAVRWVHICASKSKETPT